MSTVLDIIGSIIVIGLFLSWKELHWPNIKAVIKNNDIHELGRRKRQEREFKRSLPVKPTTNGYHAQSAERIRESLVDRDAL